MKQHENPHDTLYNRNETDRRNPGFGTGAVHENNFDHKNVSIHEKSLHHDPGTEPENTDSEKAEKDSGLAGHPAGKVWLVGAGPGDPGLLTLRGWETIHNADVILYDALVGKSILSMLPSSARLIDVGKRSGNHTMPQTQMNELLLKEAQAGRRVVRLKGGDPFVFGRGGEELELLAKNSIPFEVVPGITSAFAVPAYNGIPVTHRNFASSVHVITGHRRMGADYDIDFEALVRVKGTLIFLMGLAALPDLMQGLIRAGMDGRTPAAVLSQGTTARQRRVVSCIETIADDARNADIRPPAITVVGDVARLSGSFAWYEKLPLFGKRILVTRPRGQAAEIAHILRARGAEVLEIPSISITPTMQTVPVREALHAAPDYDWLVFTSPSGVRIFMDEYLKEQDVRSLWNVKIAVIGEGSQKALNTYGLRADFIPSVYDGETLGRELAGQLTPGMRVLIPRSSIGNQALIKELSAVPHIRISDIATYDTLPNISKSLDERKEVKEGGIDCVIFTSVSTVRGFQAAVGDMDYTGIRAVCIGRQTSAAAKKLGIRTWISEKATMESVVEKIEELAQGGKI